MFNRGSVAPLDDLPVADGPACSATSRCRRTVCRPIGPPVNDGNRKRATAIPRARPPIGLAPSRRTSKAPGHRPAPQQWPRSTREAARAGIPVNETDELEALVDSSGGFLDAVHPEDESWGVLVGYAVAADVLGGAGQGAQGYLEVVGAGESSRQAAQEFRQHLEG